MEPKVTLDKSKLYNLNARKTGCGGVFVQYQEDGKAKDAMFKSWDEFVQWLDGAL